MDGTRIPKYTTYYFYTTVCNDLLKYTPSYSTASLQCYVPLEIITASDEVVSEFLRNFWEDEGCVTIKGDILGRLRNKSIRNQLILLHRRLGINCSPYSCSDSMYGIYIKRSPENLAKFDAKVGFRNSVVVRGKEICGKRERFLKLFPYLKGENSISNLGGPNTNAFS